MPDDGYERPAISMPVEPMPARAPGGLEGKREMQAAKDGRGFTFKEILGGVDQHDAAIIEHIEQIKFVFRIGEHALKALVLQDAIEAAQNLLAGGNQAARWQNMKLRTG